MDAHPTLSIAEIDDHLQDLNQQQQLRQLAYQHPSTNNNVLMCLMVERTRNQALRISHIIDTYLSGNDDLALKATVIKQRERSVHNNLLQHIIRHESDSNVRYNLVLKILKTATAHKEDMKADFILQENNKKTNALHMTIKNDDLGILILFCKYLPKNHHNYAALNHGAKTSFEPQDATKVFVHLTPFIVYY